MKKGSFVLFVSLLVMAFDGAGAVNFIPKRFNTVTSHDDVYPYRLNNTNPSNYKKTTISTNTINSTSATPIGKRGVVKRTTNARAGTTQMNERDVSRRVVPRPNKMRTATNTINSRNYDGRNNQNVATRPGQIVRTRTTQPARTTSVNYSARERVSSQRCMSDYRECMEMYCLREDTAYNRCYCSAKLAQIDSKYQNKIDSLIQQIIKLQYNSDATSEEIKEYWDKTIGTNAKTNPWVNIDNALNIDWADTESRVRGQNAFNTGHEYCVRNLTGCFYMASNLRDAYKSEIARDCDTYETSLKKIQTAAESVIESYKK